MTESFEDAMAFARKIGDCEFGEHPSESIRAWCEMYDCGTCVVCFNRLLDRLQRAHEADIEHLRKERFREGYEAGQRSMDAEHYQLKLRLQGIRFEGGSHENLSKLAYAIYPCATGWTCESCEGLRDRLIHLLGGVVGTCPNTNRTCPNPVQRASITDDGSDHESAQGGESGAADCADCHRRDGESWRVAKRDSQKASILANSDGEDGGEVTITDELREFVAETWDGSMYVNQIPRNLQVIAYHIDEQEHKLRKQRDGFKRGMVAAQDLLEKRTDERDDARERLDKYKGLYELYRDSYAQCVDNYNNMCMERDHLRNYLRKIAEHAGVQHDMMNLSVDEDDRVAKATLAAIDSKNKHIGALEWQRDRQKKLLDEYGQTHMKLPVDANGESIHVGDIMEYAEGGKPKEVIAVSDTEVFLVDDGPRYSNLCVHHALADTAESIVRDLTLGTITEREAVRRIKRIADGIQEALDGRR